MSQSDTFIRVEDVTKTFSGKGEDVTPLRELNLRVAKGEFTALMGPSGSGKTTLLHLIAGIDQPTEGHVTVGDVLVSGRLLRRLPICFPFCDDGPFLNEGCHPCQPSYRWRNLRAAGSASANQEHPHKHGRSQWHERLP